MDVTATRGSETRPRVQRHIRGCVGCQQPAMVTGGSPKGRHCSLESDN